MKLGKKKASDDDVPAKPKDKKDASAKQKKKADKGKGEPSLKRLGSVAGMQASVVVIAAVVAAALLYLLVLQPAETRRQQAVAERLADQAEARFEQRVAGLQALVGGMSELDQVRDALGNQAATQQISADLQRLMPGIQEVHLFPYGRVPRSAVGSVRLGFASLDLARRAESGRALSPDAFPRDGNWFVQIAAPVRNPTSQAVEGSLLVVMNADILAPALTSASAEQSARVALVQTVSGNTNTVVAQGSGQGAVVERSLDIPNWTLQVTPGMTLAPVLNPMLALAMVVAPLLVAAVVVWLLLGQAQKSLRQESTALIQWAQKTFSGERQKLPAMSWETLATMADVLQRLSQAIEKRLLKAAEAARARPAARAAAPASESAAGAKAAPVAEEPLFQDKDMLDIDMLDGDDDLLGLGDSLDSAADELGIEEQPAAQVSVDAGIFRAYDIRGIVGETLTPAVVETIGRAIGSEARQRGLDTLCVGYDGRHSSPELAVALGNGLMATGCNVIDIGAVPTPVLYFATHQLETGSGVMVTGSHNPANYNGLKMMLGGETLSGDAIQGLLKRIQTGDFATGQGQSRQEDVRRPYLDRILGDIAVAAPLKVVLDAGNGIAGELAPILVEELGCEVIPMYCEVDGSFPNHHPDPGKPENLSDLIERVKSEGADLGLAFDGDGDRLGVVTNSGKIVWPDRLMMLFARDVVSRNPGSDVLYDVKCSRRLASVINEAGGRPIMWKTGHSLMKAKMKETGALLAGEMSGHVFFQERWYGFDDGLYSAARLLEILGVEDRQSDEVFADFPEDVSTPELNVAVTEDSKFSLVEKLSSEGDFGDGSISTIDGVRVDYPDGWGLCRASNTTPVLVLRFEAESGDALERIKTVFREQLQKVAPELVAEF